MKATGQITIEEGLTLNNPTLEIEEIRYKQRINEVHVECLFKEEGSIYEHSRIFVFSSTKDMLKANVLELINKHSKLKIFK